MKRFIFLLLIMIMSGCSSVPQEALDSTGDNALISDAFIVMMETGNTNRKQERAFVHANRRNWHALNFALNDKALPKDIKEGFDTSILRSLREDSKIRKILDDLKEALSEDSDNWLWIGPEEDAPEADTSLEDN